MNHKLRSLLVFPIPPKPTEPGRYFWGHRNSKDYPGGADVWSKFHSSDRPMRIFLQSWGKKRITTIIPRELYLLEDFYGSFSLLILVVP